jgi:hypothetical protein
MKPVARAIRMLYRQTDRQTEECPRDFIGSCELLTTTSEEHVTSLYFTYQIQLGVFAQHSPSVRRLKYRNCGVLPDVESLPA